MHIKSITLIMSLCAIVFMPFKTASADFGVIVNYGNSEGYTLFASVRGTSAYLIDSEGHLINRWQDPDGYSGGGGMYLTERGTLIRGLLTGGALGAGAGIGGLIREYDWQGNVLWEYEYNSDTGIHHHDIELLPGGNILLVTYELVAKEDCEDELVQGTVCDFFAGDFLTEKIIEIEPDYESGGATDVWSWRMFDHLLKKTDGDPLEHRYAHPELLDPSLFNQTPPGPPFNAVGRTNSIDYNPELKQIAFSCNTCGELFIIDHDITREEAAGAKGDFLYRWGNPANYGRTGNTELFFQHTVRWIKNEFGNNYGDPDGNRGQRKKAARNHVDNIIVFNNRYNGCGSNNPCSSVVEITPPVDEEENYPANADDWDVEPAVNHFTDITDETGNRTFYSNFISSAQKLPNGRYLIDASNVFRVPLNLYLTEFLEVEADGEVVWKYIQPVASFAPGNSPASDWTHGKPDDICMLADAAGLPSDPDGAGPLTDATQWPFRAERYAEDFKGFEGKDMKKGPLLTDVTPFTGVDYGPCPTVSHD